MFGLKTLYDHAAWPVDTFTPSVYDTAVGGQPVADTFSPSGFRRAGLSASAELLVTRAMLCITRPIWLSSRVRHTPELYRNG